MTTNTGRASILARALRASVEGDAAAIGQLYTEDVKTWAPARSTASAAELAAEYERRDGAFSELHLDVTPLDVSGDFACAEWRIEMTHTGDFALPDGRVLAPTGVRLVLHGATVAEFDGDRICSLRQYWDEFAVPEQLGLLRREENGD